MLLGVYVDDIIVAHNRKRFEWFKDTFTKKFRSKHLGKLSWFLGMAIDQSEDFSISVNQLQYISKLVERFIPNFDTSSVKHPMPCNPEVFQQLGVAQDDVEREKAARLPYLQIIASTIFVDVTSTKRSFLSWLILSTSALMVLRNFWVRRFFGLGANGFFILKTIRLFMSLG